MKSKLFKFLRFIYTHVFLRFSSQIRHPYLIIIDKIFNKPDSNELCISFHVANKRINQTMSVAEFVKSNMIYLIDPRVVFEIGYQYGMHSEKILTQKKLTSTLKHKSIISLKRVFIDG